MRDEVITDVDRQIQEALAVDPSPDFQARVRIRLSEESQQYRLEMRWLVPGVIGLAVVAMRRVLSIRLLRLLKRPPWCSRCRSQPQSKRWR
jgi:hypothetical protein